MCCVEGPSRDNMMCVVLKDLVVTTCLYVTTLYTVMFSVGSNFSNRPVVTTRWDQSAHQKCTAFTLYKFIYTERENAKT